MNASDVTAEMFSRKMISEIEMGEINNKQTMQEKNMALLEALKRAIHIDYKNFSMFLNILEAVGTYKPLVLRINAEMKKY